MKTIRNSKLAGLVAAAALSVGAVGLIGSPASADRPMEIEDSETFGAFNPCTDEGHMVTLNFDVRLHVHGEKQIVHISRTGTTDDGYVMNHGVESQVFNGNVFRAAFVDNWRSDDGSKFQVRGVFVVQVDGEDPSQDEIRVDKFTIRCLGR
jgi:hypothetical protein